MFFNEEKISYQHQVGRNQKAMRTQVGNELHERGIKIAHILLQKIKYREIKRFFFKIEDAEDYIEKDKKRTQEQEPNYQQFQG